MTFFSGEFPDPKRPICSNTVIRRKVRKSVVLHPSKIAGWGCFAAEEIRKGEFVSEYTGEVISKAEAELRGGAYDEFGICYLFGEFVSIYHLDIDHKF